jgi:hypothetical protein
MVRKMSMEFDLEAPLKIQTKLEKSGALFKKFINNFSFTFFLFSSFFLFLRSRKLYMT